MAHDPSTSFLPAAAGASRMVVRAGILVLAAALAGCATKGTHSGADANSYASGRGGTGGGTALNQGGRGAGATGVGQDGRGVAGTGGAGGRNAQGGVAGGDADSLASLQGDNASGGSNTHLGAGGGGVGPDGTTSLNGDGTGGMSGNGTSANGGGMSGGGVGGVAGAGGGGANGMDGSGNGMNGSGNGMDGSGIGSSAGGRGTGAGGDGMAGANGAGAGGDGMAGANGAGAGGDGMAGANGAGAGGDYLGGESGNGTGGMHSAGVGGRGAHSGTGDDDAMIVGMVDAPGTHAEVDDDVTPQTLGGMLPLVVGVDEQGQFDFDKAVLRPETKTVLDDLSVRLQGAEYDRLDIIGYSDRIGTDEYNQQLSERRAWAVARYLMQKGVPLDKIRVQGRGERESVLSVGECADLAREDLIACYQRDRRVQIEASIRKSHVKIE